MARKIKKESPKESKTDLLSFIREDSKPETKPKVRKTANTKSRPTQKGIFRQWKRKEIDDWSANDFIGYYLQIYVDITGKEDRDFKNRNANEKYGKERGYIIRCLENMFDNDYEEFKNYIKWIIEWWMSSESFVDGFPSFWTIFTSSKTTFVKKYESREIKKNKNRKDADNQFAEKDAWDSYFGDGDD